MFKHKYQHLSPALKRYQKLRGSVNVVDMPTDGDIPTGKQLSWPNNYPSGEDNQNQNDFPEALEFGKTKRIEGDKEVEAGGFGVSLHEIESPGGTTQTYNDVSEAYGNDNKYEDKDLHLGDVE